MPEKKSLQHGFTLLEMLITLGIMVIGVLGITQMTLLYLQMNADQKARVTAIALANEKIELIRNLPYTDVGTVGGIPPGKLTQTQTINRNSIDFTITTEVIYIDDPFDGLISTTGSNASIYNPTNPEVLFYWDMETNNNGQSPTIGNGTMSFVGTSIEEGYQSNGLRMEVDDKVTAISTGNIDVNAGRIGIWYKPDRSDADHSEYLVVADTSYKYFRIRREKGEDLEFNFGNESAKTDDLVWNPGQWYFIEAAWEGTGYRQLWRDGVPLALRDNSANAPVLDTELYIGYRGDNDGEVEGVLDELYILNNAHKYEIWGYNSPNPYVASSPQTLFYWNMDSSASSQTPQVGSGSISVGGGYQFTSEGAKNGALNLSNSGSPDTDHAWFSAASNIDLAKGRLSFWFRPRGDSVSSSNDYLFNINGCSSGDFTLIRDTQERLRFVYGSSGQQNTIITQSYDWEDDFWHFIELAWDAASDTTTIYIDGQEMASDTSTPVDTPIGCSTIYLANQNSSSTQNGDGEFDELYIINEAYPESSNQDLLNTDYKRAKVTVAWQTPRGPKRLYLITDIAPPGIETSEGGGTLIFNVFDANANPVGGATIAIYNDLLDPIIDLSLTTDTDGRLILPGAPATSTYQILVSKNGYSSDYTAAATSTYINPVRDHINVLESQITEISFQIDQTSELVINTVSQSLPVSFEINTNDDEQTQNRGSLAVDGTTLYSVWQDTISGTTTQIYGQQYTTNGTSLLANDLEISSRAEALAPKIALDSSNNSFVVWYDTADGQGNIYAQKIATNGTALWPYPIKINGDTGTAEQLNPDLAVYDNEAYIVWEDHRNDSGDIYLQKISSGGIIQYPSDIKINSDTGNSRQYQPQIHIDSSGDLYITWLDERNSSSDIYMDKVSDTGTPIWGSDKRVTSNSAGTIETFDTDLTTADEVMVVWSDNRGGDFDIYVQGVASSSSLTFGTEQAIPTQAPNYNQNRTKIATTNTNEFFIGWQDDRGGDFDVYVLAIDEDTDPIWSNEIRFNIETTADQYLDDLTVYEGTKALALWTDYSQGDADIWAGTLNYDGSENAAPFVDILVTGNKLTHENPDKPKYQQTHTTNAGGTITIDSLEWDTYTIEVTEPGITLNQSIPPQPITLNPNESQTIKLLVE